jgi:two-component system alkaline phosphatase synthesis response regulator PhoP
MAQRDPEKTELCQVLSREGMTCSITSHTNGFKEVLTDQHPDIVLFELKNMSDDEPWKTIRKLRKEKRLHVIALIPGDSIDNIDSQLDVDDFLTGPYNAGELRLRINRIVRENEDKDGNEVLTCDGLRMDLATCEVTIDGQIIELTFKEYEVLKLLLSNRGRVFTREALLNKIWGYDYYGGDRTVDVHMRRLRSKIEDATHTFIETVRNVGYRFRKHESTVKS